MLNIERLEIILNIIIRFMPYKIIPALSFFPAFSFRKKLNKNRLANVYLYVYKLFLDG